MYGRIANKNNYRVKKLLTESYLTLYAASKTSEAGSGVMHTNESRALVHPNRNKTVNGTSNNMNAS